MTVEITYSVNLYAENKLPKTSKYCKSYTITASDGRLALKYNTKPPVTIVMQVTFNNSKYKNNFQLFAENKSINKLCYSYSVLNYLILLFY